MTVERAGNSTPHFSTLSFRSSFFLPFVAFYSAQCCSDCDLPVRRAGSQLTGNAIAISCRSHQPSWGYCETLELAGQFHIGDIFAPCWLCCFSLFTPLHVLSAQAFLLSPGQLSDAFFDHKEARVWVQIKAAAVEEPARRCSSIDDLT